MKKLICALLLVLLPFVASCDEFIPAQKECNSTPITFKKSDNYPASELGDVRFTFDCSNNHFEENFTIDIISKGDPIEFKYFSLHGSWGSIIFNPHQQEGSVEFQCHYKDDCCDHLSEVIKITFEEKVTYNTEFYDVDGNLIDSRTDKRNSTFYAPSYEDENFIGWSDFENLYELEDAILVKGDKKLYAITYENNYTDGLIFDEHDDYVSVVGYNGSYLDVKTPSSYNGKLVTEIAQGAFKSKNINSVTISPTIKTIGTSAFYESDVKEVYTSKYGLLNTFNDSAFGYAEKLEYLQIPYSFRKMGPSIFSRCNSLTLAFCDEDFSKISCFGWSNDGKNLTNWEPPDSRAIYYNVNKLLEKDATGKYSYVLFNDDTAALYKSFGNESVDIQIESVDGHPISRVLAHSYDGNSSIKKISISSSVKTIDKFAFYGCAALEEVDCTYADNLETIGSYAFYNCDSLVSLDLKNSKLHTVGTYAFYDCANLEELFVPKTITRFGKFALYSCPNLRLLLAGESLDSVSNDFANDLPVFYNVDRIVTTNYQFKYFVTRDGYSGILKAYFDDDIDFTSYDEFKTYPMKYICDHAFENRSMRKIKLMAETEYIGSYAFYGCDSLEEIDQQLGTGISYVGGYAFYGCKILKNIFLSRELTYLGQRCFQGASRLYILCEGIDLSNVRTGSVWNVDKRPINYRVKGLYYKNFNDNGAFYYYETYDETLGLLNWDGQYQDYGPTQNLVIDEIDGKYFETIGAYAFYNKKAYYESGPFDWSLVIKQIQIKVGKNVKKIGEGAFQNLFANVGSGELLNGSDQYFSILFEKNNLLEEIGSSAFYSSHMMKNDKVIIGSNIKSIGASAFRKSLTVNNDGTAGNIYIEKSSSANVSLGQYWNGDFNYYFGNKWSYNDNGVPMLNS